MVGVITAWDILAHPISTIRGFGWRVFFRAVAPWHDGTFLALLEESGLLGGTASKVPTILERCIVLEQRAKRIYEILATALRDQGVVGQFFTSLAEQEQYHADLLEVCRAAAKRIGWKVNLFSPWQDYLPRLEQQMDDVEHVVFDVASTDAALQLVLQIEFSEINEVFRAALAASDAAFVKRLRPFREAMEAHMIYITERLPELSPKLVMACRELRARLPKARH